MQYSNISYFKYSPCMIITCSCFSPLLYSIMASFLNKGKQREEATLRAAAANNADIGENSLASCNLWRIN